MATVTPRSNQETISLAASATVGPFRTGNKNNLKVECRFASSGTFDAVGTIGIKTGSDPSWLSEVNFPDENGDNQTTKAVTSALDDTAFTFVMPDVPEGDLWVVYTSSSGGTDDTVVLTVGGKD